LRECRDAAERALKLLKEKMYVERIAREIEAQKTATIKAIQAWQQEIEKLRN
jgi:hypothetical protein